MKTIKSFIKEFVWDETMPLDLNILSFIVWLLASSTILFFIYAFFRYAIGQPIEVNGDTVWFPVIIVT